jgi:flagellar hook-associated protein 1 FlgK
MESQTIHPIQELSGQTLKALSVQSSAWVEASRQSAQKAMDVAGATRARASDSLARVTGVNIDHEMAILLDLEKSYQASSKVLATIDAMLAALMEAVR